MTNVITILIYDEITHKEIEKRIIDMLKEFKDFRWEITSKERTTYSMLEEKNGTIGNTESNN